MALTGIPTLSTSGVIYDPDTKFPRLVAWLFTSEKDQDDINRDDILTLVDLKDRSGGDAYVMAGLIESKLGEHLKKHFTSASVSCKVSKIQGSAGYDIHITATYSGGSVGKTLSLNLNEEGILRRVVTINNNGGVM